MGLDMYLSAKRFIWYNEKELKESIKKCIVCPVSDEPKYVIYEVMYWRKVNAIHAWFVENVQDGEDDCGHYYVSVEDLAKLRDVCATILENVKLGSELLPTTSGFFFGSTDYDEYYLRDIKYTKEGLDKILNSDTHNWEFEYHSSW